MSSICKICGISDGYIGPEFMAVCDECMARHNQRMAANDLRTRLEKVRVTMQQAMTTYDNGERAWGDAALLYSLRMLEAILEGRDL